MIYVSVCFRDTSNTIVSYHRCCVLSVWKGKETALSKVHLHVSNTISKVFI